MAKLDDTIATVAHVLDCLIAYRNITKLNNCNECARRDCTYRPKLGEMVRFNCPAFTEREDHDGTD